MLQVAIVHTTRVAAGDLLETYMYVGVCSMSSSYHNL